MKSKLSAYQIALMALTFAAQSLDAHEITTHALITEHAYRVSILNPQAPESIIPIIGFDRLADDQPFAFLGQPNSTPYYDDVAVANPSDSLPPVSSSLSVPRDPQNQERAVLDTLVSRAYVPGASGAAIEQQVRAWLIRGVVREDDNDYKFLGYWMTRDKRDLDPYGRLFRAFRHFYDPLFDRASEFQPLCAEYGCVKSIDWALGRTASLNPAFDADDTARRDHFTWQDARNNYWWALTLKRSVSGVASADGLVSSQERLHRWATTINNLGHVIHLLQDTSQPQHVRNDLHGPPITALFHPSEGAADGAFEAFTDYRVIRSYDSAVGSVWPIPGNPLRRMLDDTLPAENNLPRINLGESNYYPGNGGHVQFSTPVKFFTTRHIEAGMDSGSLLGRRGLADLSNRSFFTAGTLPGFRECQPPGASNCSPTTGVTYPLPPSNLTASGYAEVLMPSGLRLHGRVVHLAEYAYPITDQVAPGYDQATGALAAYGGKAPLVTKGIWYDIIPQELQVQYLESTGYLITYNNMRYMADVMLPRAMGYSAGMIDFFFRGRLTVSSPPDGLYAVTDQGTPHTVDADGYPRTGDHSIFGFTTVRARVKNTTADIVESGTGTVVPQIARSGRLVAIARYHRNPCYRVDLSGEYVTLPNGAATVPAGCNLAQTRTSYQEISVSAPLAIDANGNFPGINNGWNPCANVGNLTTGVTGSCAHSDGVLGEFDFSADPIPINATDLFLQVAYRGELGEEADGVAVGMKDILEPNYFTVWNNTDWYLNNGTWTSASVPNPFIAPAGPLTTSIVCFNGQLIAGLASGQQLNAARFYRTAVLTDIKPLQFGAIHVFNGQVSAGTDGAMPSLPRQADTELGANYSPSPIPYYGRGTALGMDFNLFYQQNGGATAPQYFEVMNLMPYLGEPSAPGVPMPVGQLFTSTPESNCAAYFPGPYTNAAGGASVSTRAQDAVGGVQVDRLGHER